MNARLLLLCAILCVTSLAISPMGMQRDPTVPREFSSPEEVPNKYETGWYDTKIDHFNFEVDGTFKARYLYSWEFFENTPEKPGPIFVYTGNEGPIQDFWDNTGNWTNVLAPKYGALLLFLEHRYFGESLPFGKDSLTPENIQFLSSEQALADYAVFLDKFKADNGLENSPVISVGGSYGGMLSGWFRMKYPYVVDGALAASAPLLMYQNITNPYAFQERVSIDYKNSMEGCEPLLREAFLELAKLREQNELYDSLTQELNLCSPIEGPDDIENVYNWVSYAIASMAQFDYPFPTDLLTPLPGNPVDKACAKLLGTVNGTSNETNFSEGSSGAWIRKLLDTDDAPSDLPNGKVLRGMIEAATVYFDYHQNTTCNDVNNYGVSGSVVSAAWGYLACTEQVLPIGSNGKTDFFWPSPWDLKSYSKQCDEQWGTPSRAFWAQRHLGGRNYQRGFASYSNIIFSQGLLDPWHVGGVTEDIEGAKDMISFVMENAAHHLDLRYPNPADPASVVKGREVESEYIGKWIEEARERNLRTA